MTASSTGEHGAPASQLSSDSPPLISTPELPIADREPRILRRAVSADTRGAGPSASPPRSSTKFWLAAVAIGFLLLLPMMVRLFEQANAPRDYTPHTETQPADPAPTPVSAAPIQQQAFVTAEVANVRSGPGTTWPTIAQLSQMTEIAVVSEAEGWALIDFGENREGFIASSLFARGSAQDARQSICSDERGAPRSGEVLRRTATGGHRLTVRAGSEDVLVKLRQGSRTVLAFYVQQGQSGIVSNAPEGTFSLMFATGRNFSRKCLEFMTGMEVTADPSPVVFRTSVETRGGSRYQSTVAAEYTLTRVSHGNFRPSTVNPNDFRE